MSRHDHGSAAMPAWKIAGSFALALLLAACGGGGSSGTNDAPGSTVVPPPAVAASSPIGPSQTTAVTLSGPGGVTVTVPAGAAAAPVDVRIAQSSVGAPVLPDQAVLASPIYEVTPHGYAFDQAVELALPFDPAMIPAGERAVLLKAEPGGEWAAITSVRVRGGVLRATLADFSYVAVASCGSIGAWACATVPSLELQIAAPTISSSPESALVPAPPGSASDLAAVVVKSADIQLVANLTVPAACLNGKALLTLVVSSNGSELDRRFRRPDSAMNPVLTLTYTGHDHGIVTRRSRTIGDALVVDATAYFSFPSENALYGGTTYLARATCRLSSSIPNVVLESAPVRLSSDDAAFRASYRDGVLEIRESPADQTVAVGQTATFFVTGTGSYQQGYQWERSDDGGANWVTIEGEQAARYELVNARPTDDGALFRTIVTVYFPAQAVVSGAAKLTVGSPSVQSGVVPWQADSVIAAGGSATMAIKADNVLWSWGSNNGGVLGRASSANTPQPVDSLRDVRSVAGGGWYAVALLGNHDVYAWGWGDNVGAAIGSATLDNPLPTKVSGLSNIRAISTKYRHTLALDIDGKVFGFGPESFGALGPIVGNDGVRPIGGLDPARQIAAGEEHSLALLGDGTVWAWGSNSAGQLGNGSAASMQPTPVQVSGLSDVVAIAASSFGSFALRRDGTVWSWGRADVIGRVGTPDVAQPITALSGVVAIAAGNYNVFAITPSGAFGWGDNAGGRLGVGGTSAAVPVPAMLSGLPPIVQIGGGELLGLAMASSGHVYAWGSNATLGLDGTTRADAATPFDTGFAR